MTPTKNEMIAKNEMLRVVHYCADEVERQGDGPLYVAHMFEAWLYAREYVAAKGNMATENDICILSMLVRGFDRIPHYRNTPVTFANGSFGLDPQHVYRQMGLLVAEGLDPRSQMTLDEWIKTFLDIHPFEDGNGRVASLLWNVGRGKITNPVIMPDFYG